MKILLHAVKQFLQRFLECPNEECAGEDSNGICYKVHIVRFPVGGEEALRGFSECGKEESGDEQYREGEPLAHFQCFVVGEHQPACSGVCKEHKEVDKFVHWDTKKELGQFRCVV